MAFESNSRLFSCLNAILLLSFNACVVYAAETETLGTKEKDSIPSLESSNRRIRISRPARTPSMTTEGKAEFGSASTTPGDSLIEGNQRNQFTSIVPGLSNRWWRKFKNPSFCPYVICGSSCADVSGVPRIGSYTSEELVSEQTPCGLTELNALAKPDSCCISGTIDNTYRKDKADSDTCKSNCGSRLEEKCH